eukprot:jgi/Chrzof1/2138/Cz11g03280.t1
MDTTAQFQLSSWADEMSVGDTESVSDDLEVEVEREIGPAKLASRQRQIDFGKNTLGYEQYLKLVPKGRRRLMGKNHDPKTPDIALNCSNRAFLGLVKQWRRRLHAYDPSNQDGGPKQLDFGDDGNGATPGHCTAADMDADQTPTAAHNAEGAGHAETSMIPSVDEQPISDRQEKSNGYGCSSARRSGGRSNNDRRSSSGKGFATPCIRDQQQQQRHDKQRASDSSGRDTHKADEDLSVRFGGTVKRSGGGSFRRRSEAYERVRHSGGGRLQQYKHSPDHVYPRRMSWGGHDQRHRLSGGTYSSRQPLEERPTNADDRRSRQYQGMDGKIAGSDYGGDHSSRQPWSEDRSFSKYKGVDTNGPRGDYGGEQHAAYACRRRSFEKKNEHTGTRHFSKQRNGSGNCHLDQANRVPLQSKDNLSNQGAATAARTQQTDPVAAGGVGAVAHVIPVAASLAPSSSAAAAAANEMTHEEFFAVFNMGDDDDRDAEGTTDDVLGDWADDEGMEY